MHVSSHLQNARDHKLLNSRGGFTYHEVFVVCAIIGIIGLMALANFRQQVPSYMLERAAWKVATDLRKARMQAVSDTVPVQVSFDAVQHLYTIWADQNTNGLVDTGEQTSHSLSNINNIAISLSPASATFLPRGELIGVSGVWDIQVTVTDIGHRYVRVMPNGHIDRL